MRRLIPICFYLGIGAICHALFAGPIFDWHSAWTIAWLLAWPLMLALWFWAAILIFVVVALVGVWVAALFAPDFWEGKVRAMRRRRVAAEARRAAERRRR